MKNPLFDQDEYDYYRVMIPNLLTLELDKWWKINPDRSDKEMFISAIKNRIDYYDDFEFNIDYTKFRRIKPYQHQIPSTDEITHSIQWREDTGELTEKEKNLPEPEWKSYSKAQWDKLIGRKV